MFSMDFILFFTVYLVMFVLLTILKKDVKIALKKDEINYIKQRLLLSCDTKTLLTTVLILFYFIQALLENTVAMIYNIY